MTRHADEESPLLERDSEEEESHHHHLDFDSNDERNPRAWPRSKKLFNVAIIAGMSILSPLASSIFTPGIHQIADGYHTTPEHIIATTTGFVIMLGVGPLVLAPLSETFGRRRIYVSCFAVFTLLHVLAAFSPNVAFLIAIRTISGFFGSVGIANGGGTISDMFEPSGRANVYGWYLLGPMLGPVLGPLLGGFIVERFGWWWIYWVLVFVCFCNTLACYLFLEETYAPILLAQQKKKLEQECASHATYSYEGQDERPLTHKVLTSFRRPLTIFYQPIVIILSTFQALVFSTTYTVYTQMQAIFASDPYCFSTEQVGYLYLSIGLGSLTSVWFLVPQIDNVYNKLADRNKGVAQPEYRLPLTNIGSVLVPISLVWFAWTVSYGLDWFIPILALYFYGVGQVMIINTVQNYFIDSFSRYAASAIAAGSALRSVFGGLTPLLASLMFEQIGYGWGTSVFALVAVLIAPSPVILYFYGRALRERFPLSF